MLTTFDFSGDSKEDLILLHAKLSWTILDAKFLYYYRDDSPIPDHDYDQIEKLYDRLSDFLGVEPTASNMVGFDRERPACQLVMSRWQCRDGSEIMPGVELFLEAASVFQDTVDAKS